MMVEVYKNLQVNWAKVLLISLKDEMKKIKCLFNQKGVLIQLEVKNRINFSTKILMMILKCVRRDDGWNGAIAFDASTTIPKDTHQLLMALGINDSAYLSASDRVRPFLL